MTPDDLTRTAPPDATRDHADAALDAGLAAAFGGDTTAHRPDPADPEAGTVVGGKYRLGERIGEGGMGSVWAAHQTDPVKRKVAVKLIKAGMDSKQVLARFEAERQALAVMDHPHIARVLDGGVHAGRPYFVMELVKGVPITQFCDERTLTPAQRLELFVPVCQAIQHAHQKGVIHRDIKPSNVLVALYDDQPVPKVIDFGVAKATGAALTDRTLETGYGAVVGTPQYMSPEQASLNNLDIDTRSDVYSLGVLLYELLTGSPPFSKGELEKAGLLEVLRVVREEEPPRPSVKLSTAETLPSIAAVRGTEPKKLTGLLRSELDWIVMKALEKDRVRRYETANGFAADIQRYLSGEPVHAHPPTAGYRLKKFARKHRGPLVAGSLVLVALLGGILGTTFGLVEANAQRQTAEGEKQRAKDEAAEKEKARASEEEARKGLEVSLASRQIDDLFASGEQQEMEWHIGQLARSLKTLPPQATALRDYVQLRLLIWGGFAHFSRTFQKDNDQGSRYLVGSREVVRFRSDGSLSLADPITREPRVTMRVPGVVLRYVTSSADNRILVATRFQPLPENSDLTGLYFFDMNTGKLLAETPARRRLMGQISSDGRRFLSYQSPGSGPTPIELWDTATGKLIGEWGVNSLANCSPDSKWVVAYGGKNRGGYEPVRVYSADDGRLAASIPAGEDCYLYACVTPSGKYLVTFTCKQVQWHRTSDWKPDGKPSSSFRSDRQVVMRFGGQSNAEDFSGRRRLAFDEYAIVNVTESEETSSYGGAVELHLRGQQDPVNHNSEMAFFDDERLVLRNGQLIRFNPYRVTSPTVGHRYSPALRALTVDGRFLPREHDGMSSTIDFAAEKDLVATVFPVEVRGQKCVIASVNPNDSNVVVNPQCLPLLAGGYDTELLLLWVGVVTCGELDEGNVFRQWDETTWEAKRADLERRIVGRPEETVFGPVAKNRLYWVCDRLVRATTATEQLGLLDRLIREEPRWGHYLARANLRLRLGRLDDAVADWREGRRLLPYGRKPDDFPNRTVLREDLNDAPPLETPIELHVLCTPNRPRADYELAISVLFTPEVELRGPLSRGGPWSDVADYRLGKYQEIAERLWTVEAGRVQQLAAQLGIGSGSPLATAATVRLFFSPNQQSPQELSILQQVMLAMCEFQLGKKDAAKARLLKWDRYDIGPGFGTRLRAEAKALMGLPVPPVPKK